MFVLDFVRDGTVLEVVIVQQADGTPAPAAIPSIFVAGAACPHGFFVVSVEGSLRVDDVSAFVELEAVEATEVFCHFDGFWMMVVGEVELCVSASVLYAW